MLDRIRRSKRGLLADTLWRALWGGAVVTLLMFMFGMMPTPQEKIRAWLHEQLATMQERIEE